MWKIGACFTESQIPKRQTGKHQNLCSCRNAFILMWIWRLQSVVPVSQHYISCCHGILIAWARVCANCTCGAGGCLSWAQLVSFSRKFRDISRNSVTPLLSISLNSQPTMLLKTANVFGRAWGHYGWRTLQKMTGVMQSKEDSSFMNRWILTTAPCLCTSSKLLTSQSTACFEDRMMN